MKQRITLGAYGWSHKHWLKSFYPEDLPVAGDNDWRLSYYSNEFNAVLVPAAYWKGEQGIDCDEWRDSVHSDFKFFVECHASMFDIVSPAALSDALKCLKPQLSALVFLGEKQSVPEAINRSFVELADSLGVDLFGELPGSTLRAERQEIWRPDDPVSASHFALIEDNLLDLRAARALVERFAAQAEGSTSDEATIIVEQAQLQAGDLSKFRSMLEIMGY